MKFNSLVPELSVSNIEVSQSFYIKIGFQIMYERKEDRFCFLSLEENQIMIEQKNDNWNVGTLEYPFGRGINLSMTVSNIEDYYQFIKDKGIPLFCELEVHSYRVDDKIYEDKEFLLQDPDGYLLRFNN